MILQLRTALPKNCKMQNLISIRRGGWSERIFSLLLHGFFLCFFLVWFVRHARRSHEPIWSFGRSLRHSYDVFQRKDVPFGRFVNMSSHPGVRYKKQNEA